MNVHFATASYPAPSTQGLTRAKYAMAAVLIIMAVGQLFAFEKMGTVIGAELPHSWEPFAKLIGALLAIFEVTALPSLLNIALSPAARFTSRLAGLLTFVGWYFVVLGGMMNPVAVNSGLFGNDVHITANLLSLILVIILFLAMLSVQYFDMQRVGVLSPKQKPAKIRK